MCFVCLLLLYRVRLCKQWNVLEGKYWLPLIAGEHDANCGVSSRKPFLLPEYKINHEAFVIIQKHCAHDARFNVVQRG